MRIVVYEPHYHTDYAVWLRDEAGYDVGMLTAEFRQPENKYRTSRYCEDDLRKLARRVGRELTMYVVTISAVEGPHRNRGYGIDLYLAAAEVAARRGAALGAHVCDAGATSAAARRVWQSKRFGEQVWRSGDVAWWTGPR